MYRCNLLNLAQLGRRPSSLVEHLIKMCFYDCIIPPEIESINPQSLFSNTSRYFVCKIIS